MEMVMSGKEKLLSLLFEEGRKLINLRFLPGDNVASADDLCDASHEALRQALASDVEDIPKISRTQVSIGDLVKTL
jgi:hypothetical protein